MHFMLLVVLTAPGPSDDAEKLEALLDCVAEVRTARFADENFDDLAPLAEALGAARIVAMGEINHLDGATLAMRNRLIRFLHERMGFDVLAWEAGFAGCVKLNEALRGTQPLAHARAQMMTYQWPASELMDPLFQYARASWQTEHPLVMAGFDNEHGPLGATLLCEVLDQVLASAPAAISSECADGMRAFLRRAVVMSEPVACADAERNVQHQSINELLARIDQHAQTRPSLAVEAIRAALVFEAAQIARVHAVRARDERALLKLGKLRDQEMARLFIWHAENDLAQRKIMLIGASTHFIRDELAIGRLQEPMGKALARHFGSEFYAIAFTTYGGEYGLVVPKSAGRSSMIRPIEPPPVGSFEELCHRTEMQLAFIDLAHAPADHWLAHEFVARPLGLAVDRALWRKGFDGLFFIDTMTADRLAVEFAQR